MKRLLLAFVLVCGAWFAHPSAARAATCAVPNTFTNGTVIQAAAFNQNFSALSTCVNSVDNSNIGPNGIYASQIIPNSTATATFGGTYPFISPLGYQVTNNTSLTFANPPFLYNQTDNSPEDTTGGCVAGSCNISPIFEASVIANGHAQVNPGYFLVQGNSVNNFFTNAFSTTSSASFTIPALCSGTVGNTTGCTTVTIPTTTNESQQIGCPAAVGVTDGTHTFSGWCTAITSTTITVVAWEYGSGTSAGQTMASGASVGPGQFYVGAFMAADALATSGATSIYGANIQEYAAVGSNPATTQAGVELDNINALAGSGANQSAPLTYTYGDVEPHAWGLDSVSIGTYPISSDFDARFVGNAVPVDGYTCQDGLFACYLVGGGWSGNDGLLNMKHGVFNVWRSAATTSNNYGSVDSAYAASLYLGTTTTNVTLPAIGSSVNLNLTPAPAQLHSGDNTTFSDGTHSLTATITAISGATVTVTATRYNNAATAAGSVMASGSVVEADQVWSASSAPFVASGAGSGSYYDIGIEGQPVLYAASDSTVQVQSNLSGATPLLIGNFAIGSNHSNGQSEDNLYNMFPAAATAGQPAFDLRELVGSIGSYVDTQIMKIDRAGNLTVTGTLSAIGGTFTGAVSATNTPYVEQGGTYVSGPSSPASGTLHVAGWSNVTAATGGTTYTFAKAFAAAPPCSAVSRGSGVNTWIVSTSTTNIVVNSSVNGSSLDITCLGHQ